jgi:hypothetical protein
VIKDIKKEILDIIDRQGKSNISLKEYLLGILYITKEYDMKKRIRNSEFIIILNKAFTVVTNSDFSDEHQHNKKPPIIDEQDSGFEVFKDTILFQINDLDCMESDENMRSNELSYFGVDSSNGNRWYNFDPITYLECASAWLEDYYGENTNMEYISWGLFARFLEMGRLYE